MKKIKVIVEQAKDGSFWCHTEDGIGKVGLNSCGETVAAAKQDLMDCLALAKVDAMEKCFLTLNLNTSMTCNLSLIISLSSMCQRLQNEQVSILH